MDEGKRLNRTAAVWQRELPGWPSPSLLFLFLYALHSVPVEKNKEKYPKHPEKLSEWNSFLDLSKGLLVFNCTYSEGNRKGKLVYVGVYTCKYLCVCAIYVSMAMGNV